MALTRRPIPGFSMRMRPSRALSSGLPLTGGNPSGFILQDNQNGDWYIWFDSNGNLRIGTPATVEAAGFNFNTGGTAYGQVVIQTQLIATDVDRHIFVADRAYKVIGFREIHSVVGGAVAAVRPRKITDTSAPGAAAGATVKELTTANIDLTAVINTTVTPALVAVAADLLLAAGDKLSLDFSGTLTGLVGYLEVYLAPMPA